MSMGEWSENKPKIIVQILNTITGEVKLRKKSIQFQELAILNKRVKWIQH